MIDPCFDTGRCIPESRETLLLQQKQLKEGRRPAQMFPLNTEELDLPELMRRHENFRGVFHYNPAQIGWQEIEQLSQQGRENEFLNLGPFSKYEIALRMQRGEIPVYITEYALGGVEIRSAAGTRGTITKQTAYFDQTKEVSSSIVIGPLPDRVAVHFRRG